MASRICNLPCLMHSSLLSSSMQGYGGAKGGTTRQRRVQARLAAGMSLACPALGVPAVVLRGRCTGDGHCW